VLIPYRSKNPPERFPYFTISLIAINTLIYIMTSDGLHIRQSVVNDWAVSHTTLSPLRLLTATFLHENPLHLAGNMLFLWIFGAAVEGRLRPAKFLLIYFTAALAGGLLHDALQGILNPDQFSLGASGAIMGVAAAYLYMFPYSEICMFWRVTLFWGGVALWQARWVVLMYVGSDFLLAVLFRGGDGVGHFAHLGGFGAVLLLMLILRPRKDSEAVSEVQAVRAEVKDYSLLSLGDMETLLENSTDDLQLVMAYCTRASVEYHVGRQERSISLIKQHASRLIEEADPQSLAAVILQVTVQASAQLPAVFLLRLASRLERVSCNDFAAQIYRRIYDTDPNSAETEAALYRLALLMERSFSNPGYARQTYAEMLRLFPNGELALEAGAALRRLSEDTTQSWAG
jgi:membrane associated rhomboid family serine protease